MLTEIDGVVFSDFKGWSIAGSNTLDALEKDLRRRVTYTTFKIMVMCVKWDEAWLVFCLWGCVQTVARLEWNYCQFLDNLASLVSTEVRGQSRACWGRLMVQPAVVWAAQRTGDWYYIYCILPTTLCLVLLIKMRCDEHMPCQQWTLVRIRLEDLYGMSHPPSLSPFLSLHFQIKLSMPQKKKS